MPDSIPGFRSAPAEGSTRRRWRIPPPDVRHADPQDAARILDEFPGSLGLLLWNCLGDTTLWGLTPPGERADLFGADAQHRRLAALLLLGDAAGELDQPVRTLAGLLARPGDADPEIVGLACQRISQWAEARNGLATALAFAQVAGVAAPGSAQACLRAGQMARRRAEYGRAHGWLQRAALLARQSREHETHAWSYTALGTLNFLRGNLPGAERCHRRALRIAERRGLHERRAAALHDLFVVCGEMDRADRALRYARLAFEAYGPAHPQLPALAHDVALLWVVQGEFARALPVLQAVSSHLRGHERALALATTARAAGAVGDRATFKECARRALVAFEADTDASQRSAGLLALARGAAGLGEWTFAGSMARDAAAVATATGEAKTRFQAEALLEQIEREQSTGRVAPAPAPQPDTDADQLADGLVGCLVAAAA